MDIQLKYDQALDVIVGLSSDIQELKNRIEQLEQGYKDILGWGSLGSAYSDISAAITFQDIARKALAGGK